MADHNQNRKGYFHLLDIVVVETGNSKMDLHTFWKNKIFPFLLENPDNFNTFAEELTTRNLSDSGWETFYKEWKHYCLETFNINH